MQSQDKDFFQAYWKLLAPAVLVLSGLIAIFFIYSPVLLLVYVLAAAWTSWGIYAYAAGKRFHVAPGIWAEATDSPERRRNILALSLLLYLCFSALVIYSLYRL
ncbi:hypothetical protein DZC30_02635 [Comamonas testosteroni]|uniref:Transmembrane protein n=1 Tax=Comamonas testosteroni TaxID=285 RepID=A0A373FRB5_COMTE|nr:hypothetical protein [Comamonas testosteroni]RGE46688.1 hypothetical protein DZC30_02635 [Comamonas testosteroni]